MVASYVLVLPKRWPTHAGGIRGGFFSCYRIQKIKSENDMEQQNQTSKSKGGRPPKAIKKDQYLAVRCSQYERRVIEAKAKKVRATVSEYLRKMGLAGKIDIKEIALPGNILAFTATLNHAAANLNQIAKKRNGIEELSSYERADLKILATQFREIASQIKSSLT